MKHTCDTARSGSERSENTCAACHDDMNRSKVPRGYGDLTNPWENRCECGHPHRNHHANDGACKVFVVRKGESCGCAAFKPRKESAS